MARANGNPDRECADNVKTVLFLIERANEAPVLLPIEVVSLAPDCDGCLTLVEPLPIDPASPIERVPVSRCFEYDPYLVQAVQAYAAQVSTLIRVSQSVVEGLAVPVVRDRVLVAAGDGVH